jgi:glycosyltransferase involved in cell wall biosynthesis
MWESWSFGRQVCRYLKHHLSNVDVVYANTWPVLSQALLARYCVRQGIPLVWHIKDLYPESLLAKLPRYARKMMAAPLVSLDRWITRQAKQTVVLSEGMRRVYLDNRGLPGEKVVTLLDWVDEQRFERLPREAEACARYGVPKDQFRFLYLGNIGPVAGVELLIKSFHAARLTHAQLVVAGDGSAKADCVELARRLQVKGVQFVSDPEAANVPLLQSLGHVCLLPLRKGAGMSSIPSKLIAYLLSAKPVLASLDAGSDTARCIQEAECGWVGEPEQMDWLAHKLTEVATLPATELAAMGQRGRAYGLKHFSKAKGVQRLADIILAAA